jgi:hypothetical protein
MAKEMGDAKSYRMEIGYSVLMQMEYDGELPLPNKDRLGKVMQEYFDREGFQDRIIQDGYTWRPDVEYWTKHLSDLSEYMRAQYKIYFAFVRDDGELSGTWKFTNKGEWEKALAREHRDVKTRIETHNEKIEDTRLRWKIQLPKINEAPELEYNRAG